MTGFESTIIKINKNNITILRKGSFYKLNKISQKLKSKFDNIVINELRNIKEKAPGM